jgi:hypothetical protein
MSATTAFQIGQPFDPREAQNAGRYPVDWVDSRRDLKDGPRRIYRYLYRIDVTSDRKKNPWRGYVFAGIETMAADLGKPESCVRRDLKSLQRQNLLRIERPNKQEGNQYCFTQYDRCIREERQQSLGRAGRNDMFSAVYLVCATTESTRNPAIPLRGTLGLRGLTRHRRPIAGAKGISRQKSSSKDAAVRFRFGVASACVLRLDYRTNGPLVGSNQMMFG